VSGGSGGWTAVTRRASPEHGGALRPVHEGEMVERRLGDGIRQCSEIVDRCCHLPVMKVENWWVHGLLRCTRVPPDLRTRVKKW
jgi:hypothetical protein